MSENRKFFKKNDIIIIVVLIVACVGFLIFRQASAAPSGENIAVVTIGNEEVMQIDLGHYHGEPQRISLMEEYGVPVNFLLENGTIRFVDVTCPDHLCEQYGAIHHEFDIAVCMPNKTAVAIYSPQDLGITP